VRVSAKINFNCARTMPGLTRPILAISSMSRMSESSAATAASATVQRASGGMAGDARGHCGREILAVLHL
jgi:hypothetical protein